MYVLCTIKYLVIQQLFTNLQVNLLGYLYLFKLYTYLHIQNMWTFSKDISPGRNYLGGDKY